MTFENILLLAGTLGLFQGILFCIYLIFLKDSKTISNKFLAILLIAISLRISKSLLLKYGISPSAVFINIGLAGFFAIGPALYFYVKTYLTNTKPKYDKILYHFCPSILLIVLSGTIPHSVKELWWKGLYVTILIQFLIYVLFTIYYYNIIKDKNIKLNGKEELWFKLFIGGMFFVWTAYFINFLFLEPVNSSSYLIGAILYTFLIYTISYLLLKKYVRLEKKYRYSGLKKTSRKELIKRIEDAMYNEKAFKDSDISLKKLSNKLEIPVNNLSQLINEEYGKNFTDFINTFRIEESKNILESKKKLYKISHIAYESGFSSVSAFNSSFRKKTGMTPSKYRDNI